MCKDCANKEYCVICVDEDMYMTKEEKEYNDLMCDLMCGEVEE